MKVGVKYLHFYKKKIIINYELGFEYHSHIVTLLERYQITRCFEFSTLSRIIKLYRMHILQLYY